MYDIIIIGSGPAGYISAIRASQVGLKTLLVEKENIGGMCLNWGCIPSKSMIESAKLFTKIKSSAKEFGVDGIDTQNLKFNWNQAIKRSQKIVKKLTSGIDNLLNNKGVEIIKGEAIITSQNTITVNNRNIEAKNIIIATGSFQKMLKFKNSENAVLEVKNLFTERELPENIVVYGENSVAIEIAQMLNLIGKQITLIVPSKRILPMIDEFLANYFVNKLLKDNIKLIFETIITVKAEFKNGNLTINKLKVDCDLIINAQLRNSILPKSEIEFELENGFLKVDENCKTNFKNIFAIGDVNGLSSYAHIGSAQGLHVINHIQGITSELNLKKYPINMYSIPEIAQIGLTEQEVIKTGKQYKINEFALSLNGKAMTEGDTEGFVRIISEARYGEVLGIQIIAQNATDMIAEASAFMEVEATVYDISRTIHAHPTISEVFMEAGLDAIGKAIHK
jgi:dihydrolipoamide dehydrogenase